MALTNTEREFRVGTGEARPDVVVRVRRSIVPIRTAGTGFGAVVPVAAEVNRIITQITPAAAFCSPKHQPSTPLLKSATEPLPSVEP